MASSSGREQFLKQFEQIVEGVKQNRTKVSISLLSILQFNLALNYMYIMQCFLSLANVP